MKKINILDTNVFLHDPQALNKFPKELIVIPISVIEEIDKFKRDQTELGRNARWTIKQIDALRASHPTGTISSATSELKPATYGIELANGGRLVIELNHIGTIKDLDPSIMDNRILSVAKYYNTLFMGKDDIEVFMYSKDANLRVKSDAYQVKSINYDSDQDILTDDFYTGYAEINVNSSVLTSFRESGELSISRIDAKLYANQYVILKSDDKQFELGCFDKKMESIVKLNDLNAMWGITPKNIEQQFAIDALLNPNIPLVTLSGPAGTGKTLLSVAAGLLQALDSGKYNKLLISRPIQPMGKDIGFLPGDMNEKMNPWMQPIFDNLEYIMNAGKGQNVKRNSKPHEELIAQGKTTSSYFSCYYHRVES